MGPLVRTTRGRVDIETHCFSQRIDRQALQALQATQAMTKLWWVTSSSRSLVHAHQSQGSECIRDAASLCENPMHDVFVVRSFPDVLRAGQELYRAMSLSLHKRALSGHAKEAASSIEPYLVAGSGASLVRYASELHPVSWERLIERREGWNWYHGQQTMSSALYEVLSQLLVPRAS